MKKARDYESYIHLTICIERGSPTHLALLRDAEEIGTKQLPTVAAVRLKDYYAGALEALPQRGNQEAQPKAPSVLSIDAALVASNATAAVDEW